MDYGIHRLCSKKTLNQNQSRQENIEIKTTRDSDYIGENTEKNGGNYTDKKLLLGGKSPTWIKCVLMTLFGKRKKGESLFNKIVLFVEKRERSLTTRITQKNLKSYGYVDCTIFNIIRKLFNFQNDTWQPIMIIILLSYPQPAPAEPVPQIYQTSEQTVGLAVSPITTASISAPGPQSPKSGDPAKRQKTTYQKRSSPGGTNYCSCLIYAASRAGVHFGVGWARNVPINSQEPEVGAIVKTRENSRGTNSGHVGYVEAVDDETITISEANYVRCQKTTRTIRRDSPLIVGYFVKS